MSVLNFFHKLFPKKATQAADVSSAPNFEIPTLQSTETEIKVASPEPVVVENNERVLDLGDAEVPTIANTELLDIPLLGTKRWSCTNEF